MPSSAYLRDRTADLLDTINSRLPMKSKSDILHEALEQYLKSNFEDVEHNSVRMLGASDVPNSRGEILTTQDGNIVAPSDINTYTLEASEFSVSQDSTYCNILYASCEDRFTVSNESGRFKLVHSVDSEETVIESYRSAEPALVHLSSLLRDSEESLLSDKEFRVWWLSKSNEHSQVAEWLDISDETVNTHITNIRNKVDRARETLSDVGTDVENR